MIVFSCKHCNHQIKVPENYAGKKGRCRKCQNIVDVPAKSQSAPTAADVKIKFYCSKCKQKIGALKEWAGKRVKCPKCGEVNKVPAEKLPEPAVTASVKPPQEVSNSPAENSPFDQPMLDEILKMESSGKETEELVLKPAERNISPSQSTAAIYDYPVTHSQEVYTDKPSRFQNNVPLAILSSFAGAILGAVIWAIVGKFTGFELGVVALGVGALAGFGMTIFTEDRTTGLGILAAVFAIIGILFGKGLVAKYVIVPQAMKLIQAGDPDTGINNNEAISQEEIKYIIEDNNSMLPYTLMYLTENKEFDKEILKKYYISTIDEETSPNAQEQAEKIKAKVNECLKSWDAAKKEQIVRQMHPKVQQEFLDAITENTFFKTAIGIGAFIASFSLFDLLWFPLAIWTAFKIGSGRSEE